MIALNTSANAEQPRDKLPGGQAFLSLSICPWEAKRVIAIANYTVAKRHA